MRVMKKVFWNAITICALVLLTACRPEVTYTTVPLFKGGTLTPYATVTLTPTSTATPNNAPTGTLAPTMTPTPRVYQVKANDTMVVIAFKNGLTLEELRAANPSVNPNMMSVGMTLYIPASKGIAGTKSAPTPTPVSLMVSPARCIPSLSGGWYCFAMVNNGQEFVVDNITAEFRLNNPKTGEVATQKALLPVHRLITGQKVPFFTYFPPSTIREPMVTLQIQTAMEVIPNNSQIPDVKIDPLETKISEDGLSAVISGVATLTGSDAQIKQLRVTAVAYDSSDKIVGIRQLDQAAAIKTSESVEFALTLYSLGGQITRVEVYAEAIQ
jgi:LysM repeat protein